MASLEAELLEKAKLEEDFNRDLDIVIGKFIKEAQEERKLKEEAKVKEQIESQLKEEAKDKEQIERQLKEEAKVKEQIERQLKEEAKHKEQIERQLKEEAIASQHGAIRSLFHKGVNTSEIANIFQLSEIEIIKILKNQ